MTSPGLTPNDIRNAAFARPPIGSRGYDEDQVDAFLDRAEQALAAGLPLGELVRDARFAKPPMGKRGYDVVEVDDFLDRIAGAGGRGPVASAPPTQVAPVGGPRTRGHRVPVRAGPARCPRAAVRATLSGAPRWGRMAR